MRMIVHLELEVKIEGDRTNASEIFLAAGEALREAEGQVVQKVVEGYQEEVVSTLCLASGRKAKKGLGGHQVKGDPNRRCRYRRFGRAGYWSHTKLLCGPRNVVEFRPAMIQCLACGKRLTPILDGLELEAYQRRTDGLLRMVIESVAETSYRRGAGQLEVFGEVPVPKSTAHRWVADVELPVQEVQGEPILGGDGTGFKRQPGERGEVRFVLEIGGTGRLHPLGVWAGASWKEIAEELKDRQAGQAKMFISDGERALENWLGRLAENQSRCHWHLSRDAGYAMWQDKAPLSERKETQENLRRLLAIGIPEGDFEQVSPEEKEELRQRIGAAEAKLDQLYQDFQGKGYEKAATYLSNARDRLFGYLRLWLETGIACPRATSIIENLIRELVRRLKKIGWNWSDVGAARMGRIVMVRRYDQESWEEYWKQRLNLQGRCQITVTRCELRTAA